jgi:hypothetical protein
MSRLGRSQAEKSAQALWGHSVGFKVGGVRFPVVATLVVVDLAVDPIPSRANVPGLDGPGGKPIQAAGDILSRQETYYSLLALFRFRYSGQILNHLCFCVAFDFCQSQLIGLRWCL